MRPRCAAAAAAAAAAGNPPLRRCRRKAALESNTPTRILYAYAIFLVACGAASFALSGFRANARSGLIVSGATGLTMCLCAYLSRVSAPLLQRKIGIHLGLVLPLILAALFGWRAYLASAAPETMYLAAILGVMAAGSVLTVALLVVHKPPPPPKKTA